ncbi:MAG: 16S rRNA (cytidine(1402)-2'-O)-methyltransferase [Defluviitaleaceae bacterium]|nr:16S rRNA (cytidine(1402)-2'-O)-methyltransferase [Defluviitaleaceae bacterium]
MSEKSCGILYICATPIGNLEDITLRVLKVLDEVDLIAAEDTRYTAKLLTHYKIKTPTTSYHENNKDTKGKYLIEKLLNGASIALVSDSGMPAISDPGRELVQLCQENGVNITVCPGASAGIAALVLSGFKAHPHAFEGFLPRDNADRKRILKELANEKRTIVFYEAPHRLLTTLSQMHQVFGDRQIVVCRELTKKFEEVLRGKISDIENMFKSNAPKGEFVLIIEGNSKADNCFPEDLREHLQMYIKQGNDEKTAMKLVAKDRKIGKSEVYNELKR